MKGVMSYAESENNRECLRRFKRSCRMMGSEERRGKVCAVCGIPYGKYELTLYAETKIDPEFHALEMGKLYLCNMCYAIVASK